MSYEPKKEEIQQEEDPNHRIRITISSKNCKAIERISNEIVRSGKDKGLKVKVRILLICLKNLFSKNRQIDRFLNF